MKQYVSQFFADFLLVVAHQGVTKFISLFNGVGTQAFIGLLLVPGTFHPQFVEYIEEAAESLHLFFSCMLHGLLLVNDWCKDTIFLPLLIRNQQTYYLRIIFPSAFYFVASQV